MADYHQNLEYVNEASASSKPINLKLIFSDEVASPVYTRTRISGKAAGDGGNESIKVILVDSQTQQKVTTGPVASAKVELVLLHGDFGGATTEDGGVWTPLEFQNKIVVNLGKKKNLLLGDLSLFLKEGSGTVGEIRIKHDSNPIKNVKFRLGAMVVDCPYEVKEAITDPFEVKDRRNVPKYLGPLKSKDKVWQLKNISRKGLIRKRLESATVLTVSDFVNMHSSNPRTLQEICRMKGKRWEMTVNHAKTSLVGNVGNAFGLVGSTSQQSNNVSSFDYDGYKPQPYENDLFGKPQAYENDLFDDMMTVDGDLSVQDYEDYGLIWQPENHGLEPFQAKQEDGISGASTTVGNGGGAKGVLAKKRWMKVRATLWFSLVSFLKKVGLCVGATLAG